ncbi:MAG: regulatory protein RecX [Phycisphaerales bacterium]|nr:regulatory protein RecX [Phycisphaerales bacterium]
MRARYARSRNPEPEPIPLDGSATITSIRACADDPARVSLCVNHQRVGRVLLNTKLELKLEVGTPWTAPLAEALREELDRGNAYRAAVRILTKRAKSSGELRRKLREYRYESEAIEWSITRLTELGILNDEEYARTVVRSQLSRKPAGRRLLAGKLREKGIDQATTDLVLDEMLEDRDTIADARKLAQQAARSISDRYERDIRVRRISGRLARRGFDFDVIRKVVDELDL